MKEERVGEEKDTESNGGEGKGWENRELGTEGYERRIE